MRFLKRIRGIPTLCTCKTICVVDNLNLFGKILNLIILINPIKFSSQLKRNTCMVDGITNLNSRVD